jgi:transposase
MKLHGNARLSVKGRELLVERIEVAGWSLSAAAEAAGISDRTARKWLARSRADGAAGLLDRSSAPTVVANRTDERRVEAIAALRRVRLTGAEIAELLGMALSTVSGILTRIGMGKLGRLGCEPAQRYERQRPGELIHIDVKKLGRIQGGAGKRVRDGLKQHYNPLTATATAARPSAGSSCTSPSTMPPAWPTSKCSPTRRRSPRSASCAAPSSTSTPTASRSSV